LRYSATIAQIDRRLGPAGPLDNHDHRTNFGNSSSGVETERFMVLEGGLQYSIAPIQLQAEVVPQTLLPRS
jgi:hypothetical protein